MNKDTDNPNKPTAFVIMPFDPEFDDFYKDFIKKNLEEIGYEVIRADNIESQRNILQDIVTSLYSCTLVVADLTGANSNVFYELGLAHALKKSVILLTQNLSDVPFDLRSYRTLSYDTHFSRIKKSKDKFKALAKGALDGTTAFGNPITDFEVSTQSIVNTSKSSETIIDKNKIKKIKEDERGFLDHMVDWGNGMNNLTIVIEEINSATIDIGKKAKESTNKILKLKSKPDSVKLFMARNLMKEFAKDLYNYMNIISNANDKYYKINQKIENSLEFIISFQKITNKAQREQFGIFLNLLNKLEESTAKGKESSINFMNTIKNLPKMEKNLNRAIPSTCNELDKLIDYLDKTYSQIKRARLIGEKKLKNNN